MLRSGLQARSGHGKGRPHDADLFEAWAEVVLAVGLGQLSGSPALVGAREVVMDPHPSCSEVLAVTEESAVCVMYVFGVSARHNSTGCGQGCSWGREHVSGHQMAKFGYVGPPYAAVRAEGLKPAVTEEYTVLESPLFNLPRSRYRV